MEVEAELIPFLPSLAGALQNRLEREHGTGLRRLLC